MYIRFIFVKKWSSELKTNMIADNNNVMEKTVAETEYFKIRNREINFRDISYLPVSRLKSRKS